MGNIPFPVWFCSCCPYSSIVYAFYSWMDRSKEKGNIVPFLPIDIDTGSEMNLKQDLTKHWILSHVSSKLPLHIIKDHYIKANALGL